MPQNGQQRVMGRRKVPKGTPGRVPEIRRPESTQSRREKRAKRKAGQEIGNGSVVTHEQYNDYIDSTISEKAWQAQIINAAGLVGFALIYHTHRSENSPAGFPDLDMISLDGRRNVVIEAKRGNGVLSTDQVAWMDGKATVRDWGNPGIEVYLARPRDRVALWLALAHGPGTDGALHQWCLDGFCEWCRPERQQAVAIRRGGGRGRRR